MCCGNIIHLKSCVYLLTECYSETESESETSPSPRRRNKVSSTDLQMHKYTHTHTHTQFVIDSDVLYHYVPQKVQSNTLPRPKGKTAPLSSPTTGGSKGTGMHCVTLTLTSLLSLSSSWHVFFTFALRILCPINSEQMDGVWSRQPNPTAIFHIQFKLSQSLVALMLPPCLCLAPVTRRDSRRDGHDVKQHKGRRRFPDRPWTAVYAWPLQEIVHSTQQEPCHQWEGAHAAGSPEHPEGEQRNHLAHGSASQVTPPCPNPSHMMTYWHRSITFTLLQWLIVAQAYITVALIMM